MRDEGRKGRNGHGAPLVAGPQNGVRQPSPGRAALASCIAAAILAWGSIWTFLFQHATEFQYDLLFHPVLTLAALAALGLAGQWPRFGPWAYWFAAVLAYAILGSALNPSFSASWERIDALALAAALGIPIMFALGQVRLGPRILCGTSILLSLAGLLDNLGVDVKGAIAGLVNTELVSEEIRIEIETDRSRIMYARSQRAHEVWLLFLAWAALAALRPAARRTWITAAIVLAGTGFAVATGYSWATKLAFVVGIGVFCSVLAAPRITLALSLGVLFVSFLGAPIWAKALWSWFTASPEIFPEGTANVIARITNWEYWAELIERRPWLGLGVSAYWNLPTMRLTEVFGARPSAVLHPQMEATYFPHNLPLQVWADLGMFGVLLVTGLVASVLVNAFPANRRGHDAGAAARATLVVTVLCVYGVDRAVWTEQNVFQLFLTAGLVAGTWSGRQPPAPAAAVLPGLPLRRERLVVLCVLLIGSLTALGNAARVRYADSRYTPENTVLDLERGMLRHGTEEIPLDTPSVGGIDRFDYVFRGGVFGQDAITVSGWTYDPAATDAAVRVLVFRGSELLGATRTGRTRPDVQRTSALPNLDLLFTGFELRLLRPPDWRPRTEVDAVFLGPSGSASLARVTDPARRQMKTLPVRGARFYVYVDEDENALVYVRDECTEEHVRPLFFVHVSPRPGHGAVSDHHRLHGFDNLDFHFTDWGSRKDGQCRAVFDLPDYDIAWIDTGQSIVHEDGFRSIWSKTLVFDK